MKTLPIHYAIRNLGRSPMRLALSVGGGMLVVLLIVAAAAFVRGMGASLRSTGGVHNVILLGAGSEDSIERSEISAAAASLAEATIPGIKMQGDVPYVSPEIHVGVPLTAADGPPTARLSLIRGVTPRALLVHEQVQIIEGRFPAAGQNELLIGRLAPATLGIPSSAAAIGQSLTLDGKPWKIVGRMAAPGTVTESEVWTSLTDLLTAMRRETHSCVVLTLAEAEFADVDAFAKSRLDLELTAIPEPAYYTKLGAFFAPIRFVAWATALLIATGGIVGGLNTMYAAFSSRVREIGMLQCIGFRRSAVVLSLVQESTLATCAGALVACAIAVLALDGVAVRFSMGAFGLSVDSGVILLGLCAGVALGLVGSLPPAWRCLRLPIPESLKSI